MEYIPGMKQLDPSTYGKEERRAKWQETLQALNDTLILHQDGKPRNLVFTRGNPEGMMLIDFC